MRKLAQDYNVDEKANQKIMLQSEDIKAQALQLIDRDNRDSLLRFSKPKFLEFEDFLHWIMD